MPFSFQRFGTLRIGLLLQRMPAWKYRLCRKRVNWAKVVLRIFGGPTKGIIDRLQPTANYYREKALETGNLSGARDPRMSALNCSKVPRRSIAWQNQFERRTRPDNGVQSYLERATVRWPSRATQFPFGERWFAAELNRHKGQLLLRQGHSEAAEELYRSALSVAREQEAKLLELRAAVSLARLRGDQGRRVEARLVHRRFRDRRPRRRKGAATRCRELVINTASAGTCRTDFRRRRS
jgi:hypothetical protein